MKISPTKRYAVLTGDIVASSKLPKEKRKALPAAIKRAARATQKAFPEAAPLEIEVFRGDGWQWLLCDAVHCLRIGLHFRACLRSGPQRGRGLDTRTAIAVGGVDFVPTTKVSEGDGEAYRLSGRALETLPAGRYLTLVLDQPPEARVLNAITALLDAVVQGWTGKQAQAVAGALRGWTQDKIASAWPETISQQAIAKHLASAHWSSVEAALIYCETFLTEAAQ